MNWFIATFRSSIGKKLVMAITGLSFCLFLALHLVGNFFYYGGGSAFEGYSAHLHQRLVLLRLAEGGLIFFAVLHILFAAILYFQNLAARPTGYVMKKSVVRKETPGGQTISSRLMPYTGLYILVFVIIHLFAFTFVDRSAGGGLYRMVTTAFHNPFYAAFYVFSVIVVGFHINHGFWSAFQTIGANHPKYMPTIKIISVVYALIIGVCFSSIPVFIFLSA
ncbi:MAG: succinate dehydrogenase cytochrome b subunit [Deltaproteobacteria bacterium]|nr:succinate dehydrogenase cytochrome b subunit [Deltaproteobacteria bacterium]